MTLLEMVGCMLIAFGAPFAMFCLTIAKDPIRVIILISAAFFWLLSLLMSSIIWYLALPLRNILVFGVVFSVLLQELFRFLFYKVLRVAETGLEKVSQVGASQGQTTIISRHDMTLAYVSGLGFGLMSGLFALINVLAEAAGPGTVGLKGDSHHFFIASSFTTLAFILLHISLSLIFFKSCDDRKYILTFAVVLIHLTASLVTFINEQQLYGVSIPIQYLLVVISAGLAFNSAGGSFQNFRRQLSSTNTSPSSSSSSPSSGNPQPTQ